MACVLGIRSPLATETARTEASSNARAFFEAMGYGVVREQTVCCDGVDLRHHRLEKLLLSFFGRFCSTQSK
jgi:hypothetical protein